MQYALYFDWDALKVIDLICLLLCSLRTRAHANISPPSQQAGRSSRREPLEAEQSVTSPLRTIRVIGLKDSSRAGQCVSSPNVCMEPGSSANRNQFMQELIQLQQPSKRQRSLSQKHTLLDCLSRRLQYLVKQQKCCNHTAVCLNPMLCGAMKCLYTQQRSCE